MKRPAVGGAAAEEHNVRSGQKKVNRRGMGEGKGPQFKHFVGVHWG